MAARPRVEAAELIVQGAEVRDGAFRPGRDRGLAVRGGRIVARGTEVALSRLAGPGTDVIRLRGGCLLPGFVDAHLHFRALVRRRDSLDCGEVADGEELLRLLAGAARGTEGGWLFAHGLEHRRPGFGPLPPREALDRATGGRPLWLRHRSGHLSLLNSEALRRLGLEGATALPGRLERQGGRPTGVGYDLEPWVAARLRATQAPPADAAVAETARSLLRRGVTAFADLTPTNRPQELRWWLAQHEAGRIPQRVRLWVSPEALGAGAAGMAAARPMGSGPEAPAVVLGGIKVMLGGAGEGPEPDAEALARLCREAWERGWPVAIHAVENEAAALALEALRRAGRPPLPGGWGARLEHLNAVAPALIPALGEVGAAVCVQPGMLWALGDVYRESVPREEWGWLFPIASLRRHARALAIGSDAPAAPADLLRHVAAAAFRRDRSGRVWGRAERIGVAAALGAITDEAARLAGFGTAAGRLRPGHRADAVAFAEPWPALRQALEEGRVLEPVGTLIGGRWIAWR